MKRYKKLFGILIPHKKGDFVKVDDVADVFFPLAYTMEETIKTEALRKILAEEFWGSFTRTFFEVQKRAEWVKGGTMNKDGLGSYAKFLLPDKHKRDPKEDKSFYEFLDAAIEEKVKIHGDRPLLSLEGFRKWVRLKYDEYVASIPLRDLGIRG